MNLLHIRNIYTPRSTIGDILLDHQVICHTLEDVVRPYINPKVPGATAIPHGRRPIIVSFSKRFGRVTPEILEVQGFTGIRCHGGNTAADTEGCVIVAHRIIDMYTVQGSAEQAIIELLSSTSGPHFIETIDTWPYVGV